MIVKMEIVVEWNKPGGESITDFNTKYKNFRRHVELLQMRGLLPRNAIRWRPRMIRPPEPAEHKILEFPMPVHVAGEPLDIPKCL